MFKKGLIILLVLFISVSCKFQRLAKSSDNELKYEKAIEYFEEADYYRALMLFEQLNMIYRGTSKAEKLNYYMAYCYYEQKDYVLASYYFKRYAKSFPNTDRAEECLYMNAYCYYLNSPKYSLDQSNTYTAIKELQLFIDLYPKSDRVEKANELIDKLRAKLEKKAFEIAELYYRMEDYQAAITSFENILKEYPDTKYREQIYFHILKSYYHYASNSIKDKQEERFSEAIEAYENLVYKYPETDYLKEAKRFHENSLIRMDNF